MLAACVALVSACDPTPLEEKPPTNDSRSPAQVQSEDASLVYVSTIGATSDIWISKAGAGTPFRVTDDQATDMSPSWSRDYKYILFSSNREGNQEIYSIRRDGTRIKRLTNDPAPDHSPVMSPDGSKIAFVRELGANRQNILVMNADGTNVVNISRSNFNDIQPSWAPDGTRLVFASDRDARFGPGTYLEVYTMNADGSGVQRLTVNDNGNDYYPEWSPDGSRITFTSDRSTNQRCYAFALEVLVMNADGSSPRSVSDNCYGDAAATWSPTFTNSVVFLSDRATPSTPYKWDLWIVTVTSGGGPPERITTSGNISTPRWGKSIVWDTQRDPP